MGFWGDFQGLNEATGEGGGSKNSEIEATLFMDGPLGIKTLKCIINGQSFLNFCALLYEPGAKIPHFLP